MFNIDDFIIDRVIYGWAENFAGDVLYTLKQMTNVNIQITADSKDQLDAQNILIKRFYQNKQGTLTMDQAILSFNTLSVVSGSDPKIGTNEHPIEMPRLIRFKKGDVVNLGNCDNESVTVYSIDENGNLLDKIERDVSASANKFAVSNNDLIAPTGDSESNLYMAKFQHFNNDGLKITNSTNKFPKVVCLNLKAIGVEPCQSDAPKIIYLQFPYFQPTTDVDLSLSTDSTLTFSGAFLPDVCSNDKRLYNIYAMSEYEEAIGYLVDEVNFHVLDRPDAHSKQLINNVGNNYVAHTYLKKFLRENYEFI